MNEEQEFWSPSSGQVPPSAASDGSGLGCALLLGGMIFVFVLVMWVVSR